MCWNENHKFSRETNCKFPMVKFKLNKLSVFSCVPATSTGASCTPPYSNERDTGRDEKLCSVCTEHFPPWTTLDQAREDFLIQKENFSYIKKFLYPAFLAPYRKIEHKIIQFKLNLLWNDMKSSRQDRSSPLSFFF